MEGLPGKVRLREPLVIEAAVTAMIAITTVTTIKTVTTGKTMTTQTADKYKICFNWYMYI